jgi:hypothetical protein
VTLGGGGLQFDGSVLGVPRYLVRRTCWRRRWRPASTPCLGVTPQELDTPPVSQKGVDRTVPQWGCQVRRFPVMLVLV